MEVIRLALLEFDPQNVDKRRRRHLRRRKNHNPGPNFVWHIVGHDKLKPYGISIHGCMDGYSRCKLWLEVAAPSKAPELIAKHYFDANKPMERKPKIVKADKDTEHSVIQPLHVLFYQGNSYFKLVICRLYKVIDAFYFWQ